MQRPLHWLESVRLQPLVIALLMVVSHVFANRTMQRRLPDKIIFPRHSSFIERTNRSEYASKLGDIGGGRMTSIALSSKNLLNCFVYFAPDRMATASRIPGKDFQN